MRQIVLDTETTGISHEHGHRIIEIGCVELIDRRITGQQLHVYINPERDIDEGAFKVHGISANFLQDKPVFIDILPAFIEFIDKAELIIHNASFDVGFVNAELKRAGWPTLLEHHCQVVDTLLLARNKHPGQRNSLDALCKRYEVDNSNRALHGALLDAQLLAFVYLAMTGGQASLFTDESTESSDKKTPQVSAVQALQSDAPLIKANEQEIATHEAFCHWLQETSGINRWS